MFLILRADCHFVFLSCIVFLNLHLCVPNLLIYVSSVHIHSRVCVPYVQHCRVGVPTCDSLSCVVFLICRAVFLTYVVVFPTVILQYFPNLYCVSNLKLCVPNLQLFVPNLLVCVSNLHTCSCVPYLQMCSQLSFSFPYMHCVSKQQMCVSKLAALCLFCTDMYS